MLINVERMNDYSEVVPYDEALIPLYIRSGKLSFYPNKRAFCHWHDDIECIHILSGEMNYYINGQNIHLKEKDALIVNARQMHYGYSVNQKDCDFICILYHPSLLEENKTLYRTYVLPLLENQNLDFFHLKADNEEDSVLIELISKIAVLKKASKPAYAFEAVGLIHLLWSNLYRKALSMDYTAICHTSSDLNTQKDMVSFIYRHYSENLSLTLIAASGNVCRSKCCKIFKHYLQQSPIDFLNTYRLKVSCNLLKTTKKSITEIAFSCGFNHLSYYSELFQRNYHCTPSEYRNSHN